MANRSFLPSLGGYEQDLVAIYGQFSVGALGAVTANSVKGGGIASVVKESTDGQYTITLTDRFNRLMDVRVHAVLGTIAAVLPEAQLLMTPATLQADVTADGALTVQFTDETLTAANPDSGALILISLTVRNSSVGLYD